MKDDRWQLLRAMALIESVDEKKMTKDDVVSITYAAHYLIQDYALGIKPENYDEIIETGEYVAYG